MKVRQVTDLLDSLIDQSAMENMRKITSKIV